MANISTSGAMSGRDFVTKEGPVETEDFNFLFKVPKDISYIYGLSRMSFYAENGSVDASGYNDSLVIGGIDTNAVADENGPELCMVLPPPYTAPFE